MRFFLNYIFIAVFLFSSGSFDIITHYCCEETSATLNAPADECHGEASDCCSDDCGHDGCTTIITHVHLTDLYNTTPVNLNNISQFECLGSIPQDDVLFSANYSTFLPVPLLLHQGQKVYLDNLNLRI